jgi:UrcA family protein
MNTVTIASCFQSLISIALASIFSFGLPALPVAADSFAPLKVTVKFGDLDISRPQGAVALYGRIRSAAEKVCSPFEGSGLSAKAHLDACIHKAIADAVIAVNEPALLAVYGAKLGKTQPARVTSLQNR